MTDLPIYLVFVGGWCLGMITAWGSVYDYYNKQISYYRTVEHLRGYQEGYREGLKDDA
jgi:hypothetical protein